ncbi:uncharacterized protein LOC134776032 [Penaeus indicus]|uniref:uncharacterized protein LOC134776032 n=1 Tax=Penaeus indicus TaxID=29960 RepID=UPI00300DB30E
MARTALVTLSAAVIVAVALLSSTAQAQQSESAVQETPGLLERIMTNYVYPLRDMDWRTMVRNALENMMNYIAPDAKEPKIGGLPRARREAGGDAGGLASFLGFLLEHPGLMGGEGGSQRSKRRKRNPHPEASDAHARSRRQRSNPETREATEGTSTNSSLAKFFFNGNSNVSSSVAGHSWAYLSMLVFYCGLSIFGALLPLYKMARDEILEATGGEEPHAPPHNHVETGNIFQI